MLDQRERPLANIIDSQVSITASDSISVSH